MLNNPK